MEAADIRASCTYYRVSMQVISRVPCLPSCRVTIASHGVYRHGTKEVIPRQRYLYDIVT